MAPPHTPRQKRRKIEAAAPEADALISLPPGVLDDILTRLPLRHAVRTSALSRAWRRRWEALALFDLRSPPLGAIDSVLLRCSGRVRSFHVDLEDDLSSPRVNDWLLVLSRRGLESLTLQSHSSFALHSSVFSCVCLSVLDLFTCKIPPLPPGFAGLPNLRKLFLSGVELQESGGYQLEEIIETSPLLEVFALWDVVMGGDYLTEWAISAPNLQSLAISSSADYGCNLVELPSLRSAIIDLWNYVGDRNFAQFLPGLVQVRKLKLTMFYAPSSGAQILDTFPCTFDNLKSLKLYAHFCELPPISLIFRFLMSAPNLEKLKIQINFEEQKIEANEEFQNAQATDGMCPNLRVVQLIGVSWFSNEMSFIELILSKSRLLHTLSISHGEKIVMSNEYALNELVRYRRASPQAQILFEGKADYYDGSRRTYTS